MKVQSGRYFFIASKQKAGAAVSGQRPPDMHIAAQKSVQKEGMITAFRFQRTQTLNIMLGIEKVFVFGRGFPTAAYFISPFPIQRNATMIHDMRFNLQPRLLSELKYNDNRLM